MGFAYNSPRAEQLGKVVLAAALSLGLLVGAIAHGCSPRPDERVTALQPSETHRNYGPGDGSTAGANAVTLDQLRGGASGPANDM